MHEIDPDEYTRRRGIGAALVRTAEKDPAKAYSFLTALRLSIPKLQEVGFTDDELRGLVIGWREAQKHIDLKSATESNGEGQTTGSIH